MNQHTSELGFLTNDKWTYIDVERKVDREGSTEFWSSHQLRKTDRG